MLRVILLLVLATGVGFGTVKLAQSWLASERAAQAQPVAEALPEIAMSEVLVAASDLSAGQFVKEPDLRWQPWPEDAVAETYITDGAQPIDAFAGAVVRSRISAGEPITAARLVQPGERGFLAAVLAPGMRAVSVPVDARTGVSGLVFPGDRVDLLLTHTIRDEANGAAQRATETVLHDLRVLAIDQNIDDQSDSPQLGRTATLEVTPQQAEMISVVLEIGSLSLSLRSLGQPEDDKPKDSVKSIALKNKGVVPPSTFQDERTYTLDSDVSQLLSMALVAQQSEPVQDVPALAPAPVPTPEEPATVLVFRGSTVAGVD